MAQRPDQRTVQDPARDSLRETPSRLIAVCVPTQDMVMSGFAHDLTTACATHVSSTRDKLVLATAKGTILSKVRTTLVLDALEMGADWTIWLDTDMRFPPDTISRLLESGHPVVTTNAPKRREPIGSTAHVMGENGKVQLLDLTPSEEIVQIVSGGFAVAAIKTEVFRKLPRPWFANPWIRERDIFVGEDIYFCGELGKAGIPIMCDLELSEEIGHTGMKDYFLSDARAWKQIEEEG